MISLVVQNVGLPLVQGGRSGRAPERSLVVKSRADRRQRASPAGGALVAALLGGGSARALGASHDHPRPQRPSRWPRELDAPRGRALRNP